SLAAKSTVIDRRTRSMEAGGGWSPTTCSGAERTAALIQAGRSVVSGRTTTEDTCAEASFSRRFSSPPSARPPSWASRQAVPRAEPLCGLRLAGLVLQAVPLVGALAGAERSLLRRAISGRSPHNTRSFHPVVRADSVSAAAAAPLATTLQKRDGPLPEGL